MDREFDRARGLLGKAVNHLAVRDICTTGIRPALSEDAPDTWPALQAVDLGKGILPVWSGGSERTVYKRPRDNYLFRYWHDLGHLRFGLGFTPADEFELQLLHKPLVHALVGRNSLAAAIYHADTVGQIQYTVENRRFPVDQLAFVRAYLVDRDRAMAAVF